MKAVRLAAYAAAGLALVVVIAIGAAVAIVDARFVLGKAERWLKEEKGRTLKVEGEPKLSLFPVLRLSLGKTTLTEPRSETVFVSLDALEVAVKVMPLLSREAAVDALAVTGLRANLVRSRDGRMNFEDLAGKKEPTEDQEPPKVRIAEVKVERAVITYVDEATGQALTVGEMNLTTGRLEDDTPTPLSLATAVLGKNPDIALKAKLAASARMNLARQSFAFSKLDATVTGNAANLKGLDLHLTGDVAADLRRQEYAIDTLGLQAKGTLDRDALVAALSAPKLRITASKAEGQAVTGTLTVKGPQRTMDAKLEMAAVEGSAAALTVPSLALAFDGRIGPNAMKGQVTTPIKANLKEGVWELARVVASLTLGRPDSALKAQLAGAATLNPARQMIAVKGLDATATGSYEQVKGLDLHFTGDVTADARKQEYAADKVALRAKGTYDKDAFAANFTAPKLRVTASRAEGEAVNGTFSVNGPQRTVNAKLNIAAVQGSASALTVPSFALEFDGKLGANLLNGQVTTPIKANLKEGVWELAKVVANLTLGRPESALKAQLAGAATVNPARQMIAVKGLDAKASGTYEQLRGLDLKFTGDVAADARKQEYAADKVSLQAKGTYDKDAFSGNLAAPRLRITPSRAEGQAVTGAVTVKGPQRDVDAKFNVAAVEGSANALSIPNLVLEFATLVSGNGARGKLTTPVRANLAARTFELPKLAANVTLSGPAIPQKTVTLPINGAFRGDLAKQTGSADFTTKFDDTNVVAKLGATRFAPVVASFDVKLDKLNVDRYLSTEKKGGGDGRIDLSGLRGPTLQGKFAATELTVKKVKLRNVDLAMQLANGKVTIAPNSAGFYSAGKLGGAVSADANGNRFMVKERFESVPIGQFVSDFAGVSVPLMQNTIGTISIDTEVTAATWSELGKKLASAADVSLQSGEKATLGGILTDGVKVFPKLAESLGVSVGKIGEKVGGAAGKIGGALGGILGGKKDDKAAPAPSGASKPAPSPMDKIKGIFGR